MQYKGFLLCWLMSAVSVCAQAQQDVTVYSKTSSVDTIAVPKDYKPKNPEIAALIAAANARVPSTEKPVRKTVPLAGQKEYFGSMNDYVNTFVRQYLTSHNKTLAVVKTRSLDHFSLMENVLKQYDIPKELKYLSVIESALNNKALSRVGALGPWQLMDETARLMGIKVSKKRDDRTDWYHSTSAAAKYLSLLYDKLNDWLLVVAAYNSGPGPVVRAIERTGSTNFWDIKKYLPRETQGHVLAFIATTSIFEKHSDLIGSYIPADMDINAPRPDKAALAAAAAKAPVKPKFTQDELAAMAVVRIKDALSLDLLAQELKIDKKLLNKWNDDYELFLLGTYNEETYNLRIPKEKLEAFAEKRSYLAKTSKKMFEDPSSQF